MRKTPETQVIILADNHLHQEAWLALLSTQPYVNVVGGGSSVQDVLNLVQGNQPAAILIDLPQPNTAIESLHADLPDSIGLLALVKSYDNLQAILNLFGAGVTGILSREATITDLTQALTATGRREIVLPPSIATQVLSMMASGTSPESTKHDTLTEREGDVLNLLARGLTNKDIAQTLFLSVRTVEAHLRSIYGKLDVGSRTEAALWAVHHRYGTE